MANLEKQLKKILEDRGLELRDNFKRNILDYQNPSLPHVLAAATSSGKTFLTAAKFELYYKCGIIKPNEKVLILASSLTILRDNFVGQFDEFGVESFTYRGIEHHSELEQAHKDKIQVLITIPQTIEKHTDKIKNVKWVVVDEAHKWYFAATIKRIISNLNIKYQFLLTGTPFKFNRRKEDYIIDYTSVRDLYAAKLISDVKLQVLHSSVALTQLDYTSMLGHLKDEKRIGKSELIDSLNGVIKQLIKILKLPNKNWASVNNVSKNYLSVFGKMEKTIIYTNGISEANCIYECLKLNKVNVLVSHSEHIVNGKKEDSVDTFNQFKTNNSIKVLVTVDRGKEGFNFPELYNIIDFSYTQDFATCLQMIGRLLRKSDGKIEKVFYKIAPKNTSAYFTDWMNYLIQLFDNEWYERYDGTNGREIRVPNVLLSSNEQTTTRRTGGTRRTTGEFNPMNLDNTGMRSLSFMENNKWFKSSDVLSTVATTSLGEIISKMNNTKYQKQWTDEEIINELKKYTYTTYFELLKQNSNLCYAAKRRGLLENLKQRGSVNYFSKEQILEAQKGLIFNKDIAERLGVDYQNYKRQALYYNIYQPNNVSKKNKLEGKPVICYDIKTEKFVKEYESSSEAARMLNGNRGGIINAAKGKLKSSSGFIWKYKN